jgi:type II secretory ATPase GspE/PulE/Tfp pilus assembly ATPase PilB-like protein
MGIGDEPEGPFYIATGCEDCLGKGYTDRQPIFEMLMVTEGLRDLIASGAPSHQIWREARSEGMHSLFDHGLDLARKGNVSLIEVIRMASS